MVNWSRVARRIRIPLGFAFAAVYLGLAHPVWYSLLAGGVIAVVGLALRAAASGHVRKNAELTITGPYAYTRNPLYLGSMIIAAGFAVAARSWWIAAILAAMFLLVYVPVVRSEENYLRAQFPGYEAYARQVPRFGLRFGSVQAGNGRFARELYLKHREYNALIGAVAMMAALVAKMVWLK